MFKKIVNYVLNVFDKQRVKHGDASTKADGLKSRAKREWRN